VGPAAMQAGSDLRRSLHPGLTRGLEPLRAWCDRILLLCNDLGRLSNSDRNSDVCPQFDILLMTYKNPNEPVWSKRRESSVY
jgi:hypothetical protein